MMQTFMPSAATTRDVERWPARLLCVMLEKLPRTGHHPHDDTQGYRVHVDIVNTTTGMPERKVIGRVESRRIEVRRKYNKMLGSIIGHPKHWIAQTIGAEGVYPQPVGYHHETRAHAVVALVNHYLEEQ